ncbi:MAG: SPOR domain-containing protein [Bacteroidales bacterium]|jgi:hypothetical protein|nr:SPOR domain-containing protein [Bacteroidales bacterium]
MNIAAHIGQLVLEHECVIIPGLGGFLTNYHAAEINNRQHHILPPSRKLVFNAQLNTNDGLLANFLSQRLDISYKTSSLLLEVFANYCQRDLAEGKQISFGDLGVLDMNNHHKLEFYPNTTINYNEDAFGLKALALKTIVRKPEFNLQAPIQKAIKKPYKTKVVKLNSLTLRKVAAVLIPLGIFISAVLYLPSLIQNKNLQQTSVISFLDSVKSPVSSDVKLDNSEGELSVKESDELPIIEEIETKTEEDISVKENDAKKTRVNLNEFIVQKQRDIIPKGQFHIICGSFSEKDRAEALVGHLKSEGFTAFIAGQSQIGTYRVSIQSFANAQDAYRQINWIRNQGYDRAWILNKSF